MAHMVYSNRIVLVLGGRVAAIAEHTAVTGCYRYSIKIHNMLLGEAECPTTLVVAIKKEKIIWLLMKSE